ncbi:MAG: methyltransferase domain-containing protein [Gemmataceae bacterium]
MNTKYYKNKDGFYMTHNAIAHREEEYDSADFNMLLQMQEDHFWYRGRHKFLLYSLKKHLAKKNKGSPQTNPSSSLKAIDLGGGCGGWVKYLCRNAPTLFSEVALGDSSLSALEKANVVLGPTNNLFHIDLMNLEFKEEWDVLFLLDVLEHLPDDKGALEQAMKALKPGGLIFITVPALDAFWSFNDEVASHLRRYSLEMLKNLSNSVGLEVVDSRYFMFFLSPIYWLTRKFSGGNKLSKEKQKELVHKAHQIPFWPINQTLSSIFCLETPIGHYVRFLWGTSALVILKKPSMAGNK